MARFREICRPLCHLRSKNYNLAQALQRSIDGGHISALSEGGQRGAISTHEIHRAALGTTSCWTVCQPKALTQSAICISKDAIKGVLGRILIEGHGTGQETKRR